MIKKIFTIIFFGLCFSIKGNSQSTLDTIKVEQLEEVVVTDSKFKLKRENSGKVITTITSKDLEQFKGVILPQILNSIAGIEINGARSNDGQNLNYYIRGGRNRQVLVVIDGVQLNDPSQIANDYDLRLLQAEQIERIEVLKGASSTLYGSGAATAVINVTLKKSAAKPFVINYSTVFGSNQSQNDKEYRIESFKNSAHVSGTIDKFDYKLGVANEYSEGLSALSSGIEDDPYNAVHANIRLGYKFSPNFKLSTYYNHDRFKAEFDDGFTYQDADNLSRSRQKRFGINSNYDYTNGSITINGAYNQINRDIDSDFPAKFSGDIYVIDAFNNYNFNDVLLTTIGINANRNSMESFTIPFGESEFQQDINKDFAAFTIADPYLNGVYISHFGLNINSGLRVNNHSEYGSHIVYSLNPSYNFKIEKSTIKVLASYSTAYITPSLYQLFEPTFGNPNLMPEENSTIEVGATLSTTKSLDFSVVYFNRKEKNFIDFKDLGDFNFQYKNVEEEFTASGIEFTTDLKITENIDVSCNFTYTKVEKNLNLRIPEFKANSSISYRPIKSIITRLDYHYTDDRADRYFNPETFESETVLLDSYNIFNFYIGYTFKENKVNIFSNIYNILNEDYTELFGYNSKGRNISVGLNLNL